MFAFVRGVVAETTPETAVIDVGGVGYELNVSGKTLERLQKGEEAKLHTHLHIAEGLLALYGFHSAAEKVMFRRLISITRVGPKVAIAALTALRPEDIAAAIVSSDERTLSRVPGLGKKTAQRIILELKEKIATEEAIAPRLDWVPGGADTAPLENEGMQAVSALVALGYDASTAGRAVASVAQRPELTSIEALIAAALKSLG